MKQYIAFDIGGTSIKYGLINDQGKILYQSKMNTEKNAGGSMIIDKVIQKAKEILNTHKNIEGIAVSSAGQIDVQKGVVLDASPTIPEYKGVEIKRPIEKTLNLPVEVRNDVDCAALCEKWLGEYKADHFIMLTIGTGIGGAIVINNELYSGPTYSAGEWGFMQIEGKPFEQVASMTSMIERMKENTGKDHWDGEKIFSYYEERDPIAIKVVEEFYEKLAIGIANLIYIFNPELVIIGGGISGRGEEFLSEVRKAVKNNIVDSFLDHTKIVLASYANDSGMLGAVYHFRERRKKH